MPNGDQYERDRREGASDRRDTGRAPIQVTVSLSFTGSTLHGETVNVSARGARVRATGSVHVLFRFKGHEYQGRLVRAMPTESGGTDYSIELRAPIMS